MINFRFLNAVVWLFCFILLGLWLNWLVPVKFYQPDWVFALLLGALLAQWRYAWWVFFVACVHDFIFYWTLWPGILLWLSLPLLLIWMDDVAGAGLPQRLLLLVLACSLLLWQGWSLESTLLTLLLAVCCWYQWVRVNETSWLSVR
ncbi:MAG: hypothetical protein Q9M22_02010 [Mariprofundaceae bacterium]|nr:hypothetical protein [Mariprofundaceae bacterium]